MVRRSVASAKNLVHLYTIALVLLTLFIVSVKLVQRLSNVPRHLLCHHGYRRQKPPPTLYSFGMHVADFSRRELTQLPYEPSQFLTTHNIQSSFIACEKYFKATEISELIKDASLFTH